MSSENSRTGISTCAPEEPGEGRFGRTVVCGRMLTVIVVLLMVSVSILPMIPTATAVSQRFQEDYTNGTDVSITPEGWPWTVVSSDIDVGMDVTASRVDVVIDINHGRRGDVVARLRGPDGTVHTLWNNAGDNTPNLHLDRDDLSSFRGKEAQGTWSLEAYDWWANGITGNIDYWDLTIYYDLEVDIYSPSAGEAISGTYTVQADVENAENVELYMDGDYVSDMVYNSVSGYWEYDLDTTAYSDGIHNLQVIGEDHDGNRLSDQMGVEVDNYDIVADTSLVAPADGSEVSGPTTIWLRVPSYATWGSLSVDGSVVQTTTSKVNVGGQDYYSFSLDTDNYLDGNHPVTGTAYDPEGNFGADTHSLIFNNTYLSCDITDPADGASLSGTTVPVNATVSTASVRGELYVDDDLEAVDTTRDFWGRYTFSLDSEEYSDGDHDLKVTVYNSLGETVSDVVSVEFDNWDITADIWYPETDDFPVTGGSVPVWVSVPTYATEGRLYVDGILHDSNTSFAFPGWYRLNWDTMGMEDGVHTIRVEVDDPDGNMAVDTENPTVNNYDIDVTITDPVEDQEISDDHVVRTTVPSYAIRGELYVDGDLAGMNTSFGTSGHCDFVLDTTLFEDGDHAIRVMVYDPDDNTAMDTVNVDFDNYQISVNIRSPSDGSTEDGNINVVARTQSYALKGELFVDGKFVAQDTSLNGLNEFVFMLDTTDYEDGSHDILVRVYDPDGNWNTSSVSVEFDNWDIWVTIDDPSSGEEVDGTISVTASVPSYTTHGDLLVDDTFVERDTDASGGELDFTLDTSAIADGRHQLRVVAYDPDGTVAVDTIRIDVNNYDITASFMWPNSGTEISTSSYSILVSTSSYAQKGELYVDGELVMTQSSFLFWNTYQFLLDTTAFEDGVHSLSVRCYDPDGNFASDTISVTVNNYEVSVTIDNPDDGDEVDEDLLVQADVEDAVLGECYLDGELVDTDTTVSGGSYGFDIETRDFEDGPHIIKVIVYDVEGSTAIDTISVVFDNWQISVDIYSPSDGSEVDGDINILAQVPDYSTKGELYMDGELQTIVTEVTSNRFTFPIDTTQYEDGTHSFRVKAYDPDGLFAVDTLSLQFVNYDLVVTLQEPDQGDVLSGTMDIQAHVDEPADSATVYIDSLPVATSSSSKSAGGTYSFDVGTTGFSDGNHVVRIQVSYSVSGESAQDTVSVTFDNTAPSVSGLDVIYLNGLTAVTESGDKVVITAKVEDPSSGVDTVMLDASNIGGGSSVTMFDDGDHDDGESGDDIFGTDPLEVEGSMGYHRVFVSATDEAGNTEQRSISVAVDDHSPLVTNTYIEYPVGQTAAKLGDDIRVIAHVVDTTVYVDVVLVMDTSGSMGGTPISKAKTAAKNFVDEIDPNDRSAVYSFDSPSGSGGNSPNQEIAFTKNKNNVKNTISGLSADDWTPLYDTIFAATAYAKTSNNMPVVVVLTDGNDCLGTDASGNCNKFSTHSLDEVKEASIPIFTIGLDPGSGYAALNETPLKDIAKTSNGGAYYYAPSSDDLEDIYESIAGQVEDLEVGGISEVVADLRSIDCGSRNLLYDDGNHGDGTVNDNIFGSTLISAASAGTDEFKYYVNATDVGGNEATGNNDVFIDNTNPTISQVQAEYPAGQWWAEDGDDLRITAMVNDTGNVGGIVAVWADLTNLGGSDSVQMRDDGQGGDTSADDGIFTSETVTVSTGLATGIRSVTVGAEDIAANPSSGSGSVYVDNHRPMNVQLVAPSDGEYVEGQYVFRARTSSPDSVDTMRLKVLSEWRVMAYNAQTSYFEYVLDTTDLQDGKYTVSLEVVDIAGRTNTGVNDQVFYIDNNAPYLVVNSPTENEIVEGQVYINTTGTRDRFLDAVEYRIDDRSWTPVTVPWNTTEFVDGSHSIEVRATDRIGHGTIRGLSVIVDNGNPEGQFINPTSNEFISGFETFQIKATDLVKVASVVLTGDLQGPMLYNPDSGFFEVEVDSGDMDDGQYTVGALVLDTAGHSLSVPSVTFNIDNNMPVLTVLDPANGETVNQTIEVSVEATDGPFEPVDLEWRLDDGQWKSLGNGSVLWNTTNYEDGEHELGFRTSDNLDRLVETTINVFVDNHAPMVELTSPVDGEFIDGRYLFRIKSHDEVGVDRVKVTLEGVNNYTILNTAGSDYFEMELDTSVLEDGRYRLWTTSYDVSGYISTTPAIEVSVDNDFPDLSVFSPVNGEYISGTNFTVVGMATDRFLDTVEYRIDGFGTRPIDQPLDTTLLAEGEHEIEVLATDLNGHVSSLPVKVYVDNSEPRISPVSPQDSESIQGKHTFRVRAEDPNGIDRVWLTVGNTSADMYQNSLTGYYETTLDTSLRSDSLSVYTFHATDMSGKMMNETVTTRVDNSAPEVEVLGPDGEAKGIVKYRVKASDPSGIDQVLIRIGGGDWRDMRGEEDEYVYRWKTTDEDNGEQPYDIKVVDTLGNEDIYSYKVEVNNPSGKQDFTIWWILLVALLIGALVGVAVASRPRGDSSARLRERARVRSGPAPEGRGGPQDRLPTEPRAAPGPGKPAPSAGGMRGELTTPAHKVAMRKLESEDVVVGRPEEDEVEFITEDGVQPTEGQAAFAPVDMIGGEDEVEFHDDLAASEDEVAFHDEDEVAFHDEDEVAFHDEDEVAFHDEDEVAFHDEDEVAFHDEDEVAFHDEDEVAFHDEDEVAFHDEDEDVEFLDDDDDIEFFDDGPGSPPSGVPTGKARPEEGSPPGRPRSIPLTPKKAQAKPTSRAGGQVKDDTMKGIDDLLSGKSSSGSTPDQGKGGAPSSGRPKGGSKPSGGQKGKDDPLGDLIGDL